MRLCSEWEIYVDDATIRTGRYIDGTYFSDKEHTQRVKEAIRVNKDPMQEIGPALEAMGFDTKGFGSEKAKPCPATKKEKACAGRSVESAHCTSPYAHLACLLFRFLGLVLLAFQVTLRSSSFLSRFCIIIVISAQLHVGFASDPLACNFPVAASPSTAAMPWIGGRDKLKNIQWTKEEDLPRCKSLHMKHRDLYSAGFDKRDCDYMARALQKRGHNIGRDAVIQRLAVQMLRTGDGHHCGHRDYILNGDSAGWVTVQDLEHTP